MSDQPAVATVVLLPPERQDDLLALAHQWTAAWLIRSAIWLTPDDITADDAFIPDAPPRVRAWVIGRNGAAEVQLFDELSRGELDLLRFVAVRSVEPGQAVNEGLDEAVRTLEQQLRVSKPERTRAQHINLIFAPSMQDGGSATHLVEPGWNANVVVSPEDRRTPNSFDAFSRHSDPKQWAGFMLAHTVTAAGLWGTVPTGPYDDDDFGGFMEGTHLQRVSVRGVLTGALVVNVGLQAMRMAVRDESPLADPMVAIGEGDLHLMAPQQESNAVADLVELVLSLGGGQLMCHPAPGPPPRPKVRVKFLRQVREVIAFGWDKLIDTPGWYARKSRLRTSRKMTERLHGADADVEVDVSGVLSWEDSQHREEIATLNKRREAVLAEFSGSVPARRFDVDGLLFESIRQSCFALLDGSDLPEGATMQRIWADSGQPLIVHSTSTLIPDWKAHWTPPEAFAAELEGHTQLLQEPRNWLDVEFVGEWVAELDKRAARLSEREGVLRERLGDVRTSLQLNSDLLDDAAAEVDLLHEEVAWLRDDIAEFEPPSEYDVPAKEVSNVQ